MRSSRWIAAGAALLLPSVSTGCAATVAATVLRPAAPVIVLIQRFADPLDPVVGALAARLATQHRYQLQAWVPAAGSPAAQARLVMTAIVAHARAVIVEPVDYAALLPVLRAAHDAEIPVVVTGIEPDRANTSFVVSFVATPQAGPDAGRTDGSTLTLVRSGQLAAVAGPRACEQVRAAVDQAVAAADNDGARVHGFVPIPVATASTAGLRAEGISGWSRC